MSTWETWGRRLDSNPMLSCGCLGQATLRNMLVSPASRGAVGFDIALERQVRPTRGEGLSSDENHAVVSPANAEYTICTETGGSDWFISFKSNYALVLPVTKPFSVSGRSIMYGCMGFLKVSVFKYYFYSAY